MQPWVWLFGDSPVLVQHVSDRRGQSKSAVLFPHGSNMPSGGWCQALQLHAPVAGTEREIFKFLLDGAQVRSLSFIVVTCFSWRRTVLFISLSFDRVMHLPL